MSSYKITKQTDKVYPLKQQGYIKYYHLATKTDGPFVGNMIYYWSNGNDTKYWITVTEYLNLEENLLPVDAQLVLPINDPEETDSWIVREDLMRSSNSVFCDFSGNETEQDWNEISNLQHVIWNANTNQWTPEGNVSEETYYVTPTTRLVTNNFLKAFGEQDYRIQKNELYVAKRVPGTQFVDDSISSSCLNTVLAEEDAKIGDIIDFQIKVPDNDEYWGQIIWQIGVDRQGTQIVDYFGTPFQIFNKHFHWSLESFGENLGHKLAGNYKVNKIYALALYKTNGDENDNIAISQDSDFSIGRGWTVYKQDSDGEFEIDDDVSIPNLYNITNVSKGTSNLPSGVIIQYTILTYDNS